VSFPQVEKPRLPVGLQSLPYRRPLLLHHPEPLLRLGQWALLPAGHRHHVPLDLLLFAEDRQPLLEHRLVVVLGLFFRRHWRASRW